MQAGSDREALRRVADRLCDEFIDPHSDEHPKDRSSLRAEEGMGEILDRADEDLAGRLREPLAGIARSLGSGADQPQRQATEIALDGAEFVIRRALADGESERIFTLMPSFVFLITLSAADHDKALALATRTTALIEEVTS